MYKSVAIFFALIFFAHSSFATTLEEAIEYAKINNKTLKVEDYRLEATKSLKGEALAEFLPSVSASGQYGSRKSTNATNAGSDKYRSNTIEELKAEQPIFNGFGSIAKYNEADYKIRSATSQNKSKKQEIAFETARVYCDLFRYQKIVGLQKDSEELVNKIYEMAHRRKSKRVIDESDIIKFKYELSEVKTRLFEYETKLTKARFEYRNIVGDIHEPLILPAVKTEKFDEKFSVEKAINNNENLKSYRLNYYASKSAYSVEKSAFSPQVSMVGSISRQKNAVYVNGQDFQNRGVYLNVSVPIFQRGVEYSNLAKAGNQQSAAREEVEAVKDELIKDLGQSIQEYDFYLKLNSSNQELVDLALQRVEILAKRFDAGAEDIIELMRAKIELNEYEINLINSKIDLITVYYKIKFFLGEI